MVDINMLILYRKTPSIKSTSINPARGVGGFPVWCEYNAIQVELGSIEHLGHCGTNIFAPKQQYKLPL